MAWRSPWEEICRLRPGQRIHEELQALHQSLGPVAPAPARRRPAWPNSSRPSCAMSRVRVHSRGPARTSSRRASPPAPPGLALPCSGGPKHLIEPVTINPSESLLDLPVGSGLAKPDVRPDVRRVHAAKPDPEPALLDEGDLQSELLPRVEKDADGKVRVSDSLGIAADAPGKLSKWILYILHHQPPDLGQKVTSLRLRRPGLEPTDMPESDVGMDIFPARDRETGHLSQPGKLLGATAPSDEVEVISSGTPCRTLRAASRRLPSTTM